MKKINQICECIPDEWEIGIHIRRGRIEVSLMNPNGGFVEDMDKFRDETLYEKLNAALCQANERNEKYILHDKFEA